jgi:hypothetical protein
MNARPLLLPLFAVFIVVVGLASTAAMVTTVAAH